MVSFSCEVCNDTVIKKKLDQHTGRCYGAYFSCIDCSTTFSGTDYRNHTSCISEAEKYEKALYKGPKAKKAAKKVEEKVEVKETVKEVKETKKLKKDDKKSKSSILAKYAEKELNLYKVVKKASKDNSQDIKDVLKGLNIVVNEDGKLVIQ